MSIDAVIDIARQALLMLLMVGAPLLLSVLLIGLLIGLFQAATQINEITLSVIPKILVLVAALFVLGPWMLTTLVSYTQSLINSIPAVIG